MFSIFSDISLSFIHPLVILIMLELSGSSLAHFILGVSPLS